MSITSQAISNIENQRSTIIVEKKNNFLQILINIQAESKIANEKRKRNIIIFYHCRQRQQKKKREIFQNILKLKQQIRKKTKKIDFYRSEKNYFRNITIHVFDEI